MNSGHHEADLARDGYKTVLCYGIGFYKKNCKIVLAQKGISLNGA